MSAQSSDKASEYERVVVHRRLLIWVHALLTCVTVFIFLSDVDLRRFPYWRYGAGHALVWICALPTLPYLVSAVRAWKVVTDNRLRLSLFLVIVVAGFVLMALVLGGAFGELSRIGVALLFLAQMIVYLLAAEVILLGKLPT